MDSEDKITSPTNKQCDKHFKCKLCNFSTEVINEFGNHLKNVHNEVLCNPNFPFACDKCNYRSRFYNGKNGLMNHIKSQC